MDFNEENAVLKLKELMLNKKLEVRLRYLKFYDCDGFQMFKVIAKVEGVVGTFSAVSSKREMALIACSNYILNYFLENSVKGLNPNLEIEFQRQTPLQKEIYDLIKPFNKANTKHKMDLLIEKGYLKEPNITFKPVDNPLGLRQIWECNATIEGINEKFNGHAKKRDVSKYDCYYNILCYLTGTTRDYDDNFEYLDYKYDVGDDIL